MSEISRAYYLAHSGKEPTVSLGAIFDAHSDILSDESLHFVLGLSEGSAEGSEDSRSSNLLLDWQVESHVSRVTAELDERIISWEGSATATTVDGRVIPYQRLLLDISNAADRRERHLLEEARTKLVGGELSSLRRERLNAEVDAVAALGIADSYLGAFAKLSGIDVDGLVGECRAFLNDTAAMWTEAVRDYLRPMGVKPGEATRADALHLFRAEEYDGAFPAAGLLPSVGRQVTEMGLDMTASGRIILDVEEREGKRSRAFCAPVQVPNEVYLVLRPHGGRNDYRTFLHEFGHALHFASPDSAAPFEHRWLGDNSVTEGYAMLFDHLSQNAGWVSRYSELPASMSRDYLRRSGFEELHYVRRYCSKLIFEHELYSAGGSAAHVGERFAEIMREGTSFEYDPCDAYVDLDSRLYAVRYLRAWQLQAVFSDALVQRYDEDWYRNPRAGPWLVAELMSAGQRESAGELAARAAGTGLSFDPLRTRIEALLS